MTSVASKCIAVAVAGSIAIVLTPPRPASASSGQFLFGVAAGAIIGGILTGKHPHQPSTGPRHKDKTAPSTDVKEEAKPKDDSKSHEAALASLGANKSLTVLGSVTFKSVNASAGSDDSSKLGKSSGVHINKVDLPQTLSNFVTRVGKLLLSDKQVGDVSVVSVESLLNTIYDEPGPENLRQFEQIAGDSWTADQFKVDMLNVASNQLNKFAVGNNRGMVTMVQIDKLLRNSAHEVYARTFELSELIAMNKHIVDFDRALWENTGADAAANPAVTPAVDLISADSNTDADDTADAGASTTPGPVVKPIDTAAVGQPSKMSHINTEMVRIAQTFVDGLAAEATKGMRDRSDAVRYRMMRATVDCFRRIVANPTKSTGDVAATTTSASADKPAAVQAVADNAPAAADQRYADLVNSFQKSIEKKDPKSGKDVDGECRVAINTLIGADQAATPGEAAKPAAPRNSRFLLEPELIRAVWSGSEWTPSARSN